VGGSEQQRPAVLGQRELRSGRATRRYRYRRTPLGAIPRFEIGKRGQLLHTLLPQKKEKQMNRVSLSCGFCLWAAVFYVATPLHAELLHDHFDDGVLDPMWSVELNENVASWSYAEAGTNLTVDNIVSKVVSSDPWNGFAATVSFTRSVTPLADFHVYFDFSWDSANDEGRQDTQAAEYLRLYLLDGNGDAIAFCGHYDPWVQLPGEIYAAAGENAVDAGYPLPLAGSGSAEITRTAQDVAVLWNGSPIVSGIAAAPVEGVQLEFWHGPFSGWIGARHYTSFFGSESVDRVSFIPEPGTMALLAVGSSVWVPLLWRRRRRKRNA
jgi:hypothetical protein